MVRLAVCFALSVMGLVSFAERYSENTTVSGAEPLVIAAGEKLEFDVDAGVTVTVTRVISGPGQVVRRGAGTLRLQAANTFEGGLSVEEGFTWLDVAGSLGSGPLTYDKEAPCVVVFNANGATFANEIVFNKTPGTIDGALGNKSNKFPSLCFLAGTRLTGNLTGKGGVSAWTTIGTVRYNFPASVSDPGLVVDGDVDFSSAILHVYTYGKITFNGRVLSPSNFQMNNTWSAEGIVVFNRSDNNLGGGNLVGCYCPYIVCGAVNALSNFYWRAFYNYTTLKANVIDLNGFDQRMKAMVINPVGNADYVPPAAPNEQASLQFTSAKSATLTLTGTGANRETFQHAAFNGALSVVLDADPTYTLALSNRTHRMSGALIVSNGTMKASLASSFPSARKVAVAPGAALLLESTQNVFPSCREMTIDGTLSLLSDTPQTMNFGSLSLGETGSFTLTEGTMLTVKRLFVNGEEVPSEHVYTAPCAEIPQLKAGSIRVRAEVWPELVEPVYTVTVPAGETNRIEELTVQVTSGGETSEQTFTSLGNLTAGTVRKLGTGVVVSSRQLSTFTGQVLVEAGGFKIDDNLQIGPTNKTSDACTVWVKRGASFIISKADGSEKLNLRKTIFHLSGDGLNGLGAIDTELFNSGVTQNTVFDTCGGWTLEGDARIGGYGTARLDCSNFTLDMQGFALEVDVPKGQSSRYNMFLYLVTIKNAGDIILNGSSFCPQGVNYWTEGIESTIVVTNGANFGYYNSSLSGTSSTTLRFASGARTTWSVGGSANDSSQMTPGNVRQGWWDGPVRVDGTVSVYGSGDRKGAALRGKLSGTGSLRMSSGWLHLYSSENDFAGSLSIEPTTQKSYMGYPLGLALYANGALPLACPSVSITNGACALLDAARFDLPPVAFHATAGTNLEFYCANAAPKAGTLACLRKDGPGSVTYKVPLAVTGVVEAVEGILDTDGKALSVGSLAIAGGTIRGDVAVTDAVTCRPDALQSGAFSVLTVDGRLTFAAGATLDLDALVASGAKVRRSGLLTTVVRATGGITGVPTVAAGSATDAACWSCAVEGNELKVVRSVGTMILVR